MTTVVLSVELEVDIPGSEITSKAQSVHDAAGVNRTTDFRQFCANAGLPLNRQAEIELALLDYVKARNQTLL